MIRWWLVLFVAICLAPSERVFAVEPHEMLSDPVSEKRARELSEQLRCLQCQNETIDTSNAEVARDLRRHVREQIVAGKTDEQIIAFLVEKYGPFIQMEPPVQPTTLPLWYGPYFVLILGLLGGGIYIYRRRGTQTEPALGLTESEKKEIDKMLSE